MNQIHQREREIVKHVCGGDDRIEFDGVEKQWLAIHQRNIGEMKIPMAAPDEPLLGTLLEQYLERHNVTVATGIELIDGASIDSMHFAELCCVAVDDSRNRGEPGFAVGTRRFLVCPEDCLSNSNRKRRSDLL